MTSPGTGMRGHGHTSTVTSADGVALHVEVAGDGPPVLLVHGFPDSGRLWRHQIGPLVESGRRVIVPDMRGMGASNRPEGVEAYRLSRVVADLLAVLDAAGAERADVIAHDWGAAASWVLAALHPHRVRSLAALSVGHPAASRPPTLEMRQKAWYQLYFLFDEAEELLLRESAALLREWLGPAVDRDRYLDDLRRPGALTAGLNYYRANAHPRRELLQRRTLPPVAAPVLGLWSTGDRYLAEEAMTRSAAHVTGPWRYERIEAPTHWLQLDAPERVNALLLEHLSG
jgi:pimeloyl-ACP methyl ester carboxylesterase